MKQPSNCKVKDCEIRNIINSKNQITTNYTPPNTELTPTPIPVLILPKSYNIRSGC